MHAQSHHARQFLIALLLSLLSLALLARTAHPAWSMDPVQVDATTGQVPFVSACDDGHYGAIVVWQQQDGAGKLLKARHLLANGDLDPAWPAAVTVSSMSAPRAALGAVPDHQGGAYVWWMEGAGLLLTRIAANGSLAGGWPARGRMVGSLVSSEHRPNVVADATGGLYAVWIAAWPFVPTGVVIFGLHVGPANTPSVGWPLGTKALGETAAWSEFPNAAAISAAPDGGLWLAFATTVFDAGNSTPGDVRLARLTAAGAPSPGWDAHGVSLGAFHGDLIMSHPQWLPVPRMNLIAVAHDGGSGAYVLGTDLVTDLYQNVSPAYAVHRIGGDGLRPAGWPVQGLSFAPPWGFSNTVDAGEFASLRALPDGRGGAFLGVPGFGSEATSLLQFVRFAADGGTLPGGVSLDTRGIEAASRGDGGMFAASYFPSGPTNIYTPNAYVSVQQTVPGSGYYEYSAQPVATRYGDIGLTATDDGGAIFVWSQYIDRQGVFAVRLGPAGVVTGVTPPNVPVGPPSLKLRFVPGVGVRALVASVPSGREELWLHDSSGRLVASARIESASGGDWVFPGTERLRSGMYFARAVSAGVVLNARIAVIR